MKLSPLSFGVLSYSVAASRPTTGSGAAHGNKKTLLRATSERNGNKKFSNHAPTSLNTIAEGQRKNKDGTARRLPVVKQGLQASQVSANGLGQNLRNLQSTTRFNFENECYEDITIYVRYYSNGSLNQVDDTIVSSNIFGVDIDNGPIYYYAESDSFVWQDSSNECFAGTDICFVEIDIDTSVYNSYTYGLSCGDPPPGYYDTDGNTLTIIDGGCSNGSCGLCQGDCDDDTDCADGLKCFQRTKANKDDPVPGCTGDAYRKKDYCYSPDGGADATLTSSPTDAPTKSPTDAPTNAPTKTPTTTTTTTTSTTLPETTTTTTTTTPAPPTNNNSLETASCATYNNFGQFKNAVQSLPNGGTLVVCAGSTMTASSTIIVQNKVHLYCQTGQPCTINGGARHFLIKGADGELTLENFTLQGATFQSVRVEADAVKEQRFVRCTFQNNVRSGPNGGAIFGEVNTNILVDSCTFQQNYANYYGSAIYMLGSTLQIYNSIFRENYGAANGDALLYPGAVSIDDATTLFVQDSAFIDNSGGVPLHITEGGQGVWSDGGGNTATGNDACNGIFRYPAALCVAFESVSEATTTVATTATTTTTTTVTATEHPTMAPTTTSTKAPTKYPTRAPTNTPTNKPTNVPTDSPTGKPTSTPTRSPTDQPTKAPVQASTNQVWDTIITNDFDSGWQNFADGGDDAGRSTNFARSGSYSLKIQDNSGVGSSITSTAMDVSLYSVVRVKFSFYADSMEDEEDFWLRTSTDDGQSWTTVQTWAQNPAGFSNGQWYIDETVDIDVQGNSDLQIRFQCDASGNKDRIYIDDVLVEGKLSSTSGTPAPTTTVKNPSPTTSPTDVPTKTPTNAPTKFPTGGLPVLTFNGDCPSSGCDVCEGDCDSEDDCIGDLVCWERTSENRDDPVPGCQGEGHNLKDYCVAPGTIPTPSPTSASDVNNEWLVAHNTRRQAYHTQYNTDYVPLKWSASLAQKAQDYANLLLSKSGCLIQHSLIPYDEGENLNNNWGTGSYGVSHSPEKVLTRWTEEEECDNYPDNSHFTQVLWRATKYVGCAIASKPYPEYADGAICNVQVCRYAKTGNCNVEDGNDVCSSSGPGDWFDQMIADDTPCGPDCPDEGCF